MNDYTGKICPYCKTGFKAGDDIVLCSACDMPHHKDCWIENQGCTTFGCTGTIKAVDNSASSVTMTQMQYEDTATKPNSGFVFCTQCGTRNANTSFFCHHCGSRLATGSSQNRQLSYTQTNSVSSNSHTYTNTPYQQNAVAAGGYSSQQQYQQSGYQQPSYRMDGYQTQSSFQPGGYQPRQTAGIDADVQQLIGIKTEYYVPQFLTMKSQNKKTSWNWAAFLVAPYWMIYRKMYGYGAVVVTAEIIIWLIDSGLLSILALAGYIAMGILGNHVYMSYLESKADQAKSMGEPYKSQFLASNSGVNKLATVLTIIGRILLIAILSA